MICTQNSPQLRSRERITRFASAQRFSLSKLSMMPQRHKGFTLSEVLITLGIIGVLAAMTIPTLIQNTVKQQYVESLKKTYSSLENGFSKIMADEGISHLGQSTLFDGNVFSDANRQNVLDETLKTAFNMIKICKVGDNACNFPGDIFSDIVTYKFYTPDGVLYRLYLNTTCVNDDAKVGKMKAECGHVWVDINGPKKPNTYDKDWFLFRLGQDGHWYSNGGSEYARFTCGENIDSCNVNWKYWGGCRSGAAVGYHLCTGQIMEEGWTMNY